MRTQRNNKPIHIYTLVNCYVQVVAKVTLLRAIRVSYTTESVSQLP